jgi:hypothetical protein
MHAFWARWSMRHGRGLGAHRLGVVQLEAGELDGEDVVRRRVHDRLDERQADVARGHAPQPGRAEDLVEHLHRGGLAVGAGHGEPRHRSAVGPGVAQPPGELDLAPHRDAALAGLGDQRRRRLPARRDDQQLRTVRQCRGRALAEPDVGAEDAEQLCLILLAVALLVERDDGGAQVGEVVGRGESAHAEARHHGLDPGPVVVAAECRDVSAHGMLTPWRPRRRRRRRARRPRRAR